MIKSDLSPGWRGKYFTKPVSDALLLAGSLLVISLLMVPYVSNGYWYDDALNSQIHAFLHRVDGSLGDFSYRVVMHWLQQEGRLMLGFFYGYAGFYFFNNLEALRLVHGLLIVANIALYGYMLRLLGARNSFVAIWAILLVGLFQIHGRGLDPVAGFAFHYPLLGIQLSITLILFVKWVEQKNLHYLHMSLSIWLLSMLCYEANFIFIPIAFAVMYISDSRNKRYPWLLLVGAMSLYLGLAFYLKSQAVGGTYAGTSFGEVSKMLPAYFKQLSATFPLASYLAATHQSLPIGALFNEMINSALAWAVFISSLIIIKASISTNATKQVIRREAILISVGMLLLPAVFPAISLRYQNEVGWGVGTLPVYYQYFGLAFLLAWAVSGIPKGKAFQTVVPVIISCYLALNVTMNTSMANSVDAFWREPRETLIVQAQTGLFDQVREGDIVHTVNVAHYINANLIYEGSGKRVYVPTDDHAWYPEAPGAAAKSFELSRNEAGKYEVVQRQAK